MLFGRKKKNPIIINNKQVSQWKYSTCGYCSVGCSLEIGLDKQGVPVTTRGVGGADVNQGKLCIKGLTEAGIFDATGRGTSPRLRNRIFDPWRDTSWDEALDDVADNFKAIQQKYGRDSIGIVSTGQLFTEEFYTLGKFVRGVLGTNHYDGNTTLCMASAVSGYKRSFGSDGPPGCYDDFSHTHCILAIGSNLPEQHPIIYWRMKEAREQRNIPLIVVDPRKTMLGQMADYYLPLTPGTDLVLLNSMAFVILDEQLEDKAYIEAHTNGYDQFYKVVKGYDPSSAAKICGIDEDTIRNVARLYAKAPSAMSFWTMGINQSTHGSDGVCAINNLNLITGNIGKPGGTSLSITGQCNAMGTREWSSCSGLPGYRLLENKEHREEIANFWGIDESVFPEKAGLKQTDIFPAIESGQIKALWIIATNPMTSMPNTSRIRKTLEKLDYCVVQDSYQDVETAEYAHAYLPGAPWAEKEGCFTNTERRVNITRKVREPLGNSKADHWIISQLAQRWEQGRNMHFADNAAEIFTEMTQLSSLGKGPHGQDRILDISGMTHDKIEQQRGIQWPCPEGQEQGSPRLYEDGIFQFAGGKAKLLPLPYVENNEMPDTDFPLWLNSGRVVEHFHTRTKTGKVGNCNKFSPMPYMEMNPDAAAKINVEHMQYVRVVSRRGDAVVMVQLTQRVPYDMVFIPFHYYDCVNRLSLGLLDPYSRQPAFKQAAVRIEPIDQAEAAKINQESRNF